MAMTVNIRTSINWLRIQLSCKLMYRLSCTKCL